MNAAIIGRRGLGKSTLALKIADDLNPNVLIFDTNNQFRSMEHRTSDVEKVEKLIRNSTRMDDPFRLAFIPQGEVEEEWDKFAKVIWPFGDYALIVDETHRLQKAQYVNRNLDKFMRQAPRRERHDPNPIDVIQCCHRPQDINGNVFSLLDYVYLFRVTKSRDLQYIENEFEPEVRQVVTKLRTPPEGRDVLRVDVEGNDNVLLTDSKEWFTPIREPKEKNKPLAIPAF